MLLLLSGHFRIAIGYEPGRIGVAVLDLGPNQTASRATETVFQSLSRSKQLRLIEQDQARSAALGIGYEGSMNMTLEEARNLGNAIGCDFYLIGDAQTLRRSPSNNDVYFEAYASIFLISTRTGRLINWERLSFDAAEFEAAADNLMKSLASRNFTNRYAELVATAQEDERKSRLRAFECDEIPIAQMSDEELQEDNGMRLPRPMKRLTPPYPETASRAEVQATVDALVDIDSRGEVTKVVIVRWAGFGLDNAVEETIRKMHFWPASRDGVPIPLRVLLRYNFREPPKESKASS